MKKKDDKGDTHKIPRSDSGEKQVPTPKEIEAARSLWDLTDGEEVSHEDSNVTSTDDTQSSSDGLESAPKAGLEEQVINEAASTDRVTEAADIPGEKTVKSPPAEPPIEIQPEPRQRYESPEAGVYTRLLTTTLEGLKRDAGQGINIFEKYGPLLDAPDRKTFVLEMARVSDTTIDDKALEQTQLDEIGEAWKAHVKKIEECIDENRERSAEVAGAIAESMLKPAMKRIRGEQQPARYAPRESSIGMNVLTYGAAVVLGAGWGFFAGQLMYKGDSTKMAELEARIASTELDFDKYKAETVSATAELNKELGEANDKRQRAKEQHEQYQREVEEGKKAAQEDIDRLKRNIADLKEQYEADMKKLDETAAQRNAATAELEKTRGRHTAAEKEQEQTRKQLTEMKELLERTEDLLGLANDKLAKYQEAQKATAATPQYGPAQPSKPLEEQTQATEGDKAPEPKKTPADTTSKPTLDLDYLISNKRTTFDPAIEAQVRDAPRYTPDMFGVNVDARIRYMAFIDIAQSHLENGTWGTPGAQKELREAYKELRDAAPGLMDKVDVQLEGMRRTFLGTEQRKGQQRRYRG